MSSDGIMTKKLKNEMIGRSIGEEVLNRQRKKKRK